MTRRKPLTWFPTHVGEIPSCDPCTDLYLSPSFKEAIYSVLIERPGDPRDLARRTIERYHLTGHKDY